MSKQAFEKEIRKELDRLNRRIDEKIIRGLSYAAEARRHKQLIARLRGPQVSWFSRSLSYVSALMF
jgi:hypothetical protein